MIRTHQILLTFSGDNNLLFYVHTEPKPHVGFVLAGVSLNDHRTKQNLHTLIGDSKCFSVHYKTESAGDRRKSFAVAIYNVIVVFSSVCTIVYCIKDL